MKKIRLEKFMIDSKNLEKNEVKEYFNGTGFDRWNRIYSKSDDVNRVQKNIRIGHQKTVDDVIKWIKKYPELSKMTFCDAGCGVGSLTIPLLTCMLLWFYLVLETIFQYSLILPIKEYMVQS